jgi:hypothetical protein
MPAMRHDPERRGRNGAVQLHPTLHRIQRIAITVDDKAPRGNHGEGRRIEVHVLAIVGESARVPPEGANLIVAVDVSSAHVRPFRFRATVLGHRPHDGACRCRKVRCAADVNQGLDPRRLLRGHVQQRVGACTQADRLHAADAETIEQREEIPRDVGESENAGRIRRIVFPVRNLTPVP